MPIEADGEPGDFGNAGRARSRRRSTGSGGGRPRSTRSLEAHGSQSENIFFLQMGEDLFTTMMGTESFVRAYDTTGAPVPEDDLFAGLR